MEDFNEFKNKVLSLLTKEFSKGNYDSLKNLQKEIIALAKNMNYKEDYSAFRNETCTTLKFYSDEDYTISFYETNKYNCPYMSITVRSNKKKFEVSFFK